MKILVEIKNVYGKKTIYPVCDTAKLFADLVGTKTLTDLSIQIIKELGYSIEVKAQTL